jgi:hypothetical protein
MTFSRYLVMTLLVMKGFYQVGSATMALGRLLAPHLERGATRALTHISGQSSLEASSQLKIGATKDTHMHAPNQVKISTYMCLHI